MLTRATDTKRRLAELDAFRDVTIILSIKAARVEPTAKIFVKSLMEKFGKGL